CDADAEAKAPARDLVQERGALGEVVERARVDRRNCGAERDALGRQSKRVAQGEIGKAARRIDAGKAAPLDLAREIEREAAPPRRMSRGEWSVRRGRPAPATRLTAGSCADMRPPMLRGPHSSDCGRNGDGKIRQVRPRLWPSPCPPRNPRRTGEPRRR